MILNELKKLCLAAKRLKIFLCISAIIFASVSSKENDDEPKNFLVQRFQVLFESFLMVFIVEITSTWMLHFTLGLKEDGWLSVVCLLVIHFLWIGVTIFGLNIPSNQCNTCNTKPLLFTKFLLVFLISIAATFLLKLLFKIISRLFFAYIGTYQPTDIGSPQNDLPHQSQADIINDHTKESSTNSEQYMPSGLFSYENNYTDNTNMADSHQGPHTKTLQADNHQGLHGRMLLTKDHHEQNTCALRAMQLQESHSRTLQSEVHQGPHTRTMQTGDHEGLHTRTLQTEDHQGQNTCALRAMQPQVSHSRTLQSEDHQGHTRTMQTGDDQGQHTRMLQTKDHQGQHTRPLPNEDLQGSQNNFLKTLKLQGPLQKILPTKTLLERRAEAKQITAANGAGGILCSSQGNTQQSKGKVKNNSNKISDRITDENNVISQGRRQDQPPAQNSVAKTRSGRIYRSF